MSKKKEKGKKKKCVDFIMPQGQIASGAVHIRIEKYIANNLYRKCKTCSERTDYNVTTQPTN